MNKLQKVWNEILSLIRFILEPKSYKTRRKLVLAHYKKTDLGKQPIEIVEALKFLKYHKYNPFPFKWILKYDHLKIKVFKDESLKRFYVYFNEKKLYYPLHFTKKHCVWATRSILKEQDPQSAHLYLTENFQVDQDSIVIDAGVAEGNFSLLVIDKVKKIFLIECDPAWVEALKLTFEPWKEKVVFVQKNLSDINDDNSVTIDSLVEPQPNEKYFVKMDIEGYEKRALAGMTKLLTAQNSLKMDICTYHHPNDLIDLSSIVKKFNLTWRTSDSYVLFFLPGEQPSFRKALIRVERS